MDEIIAGMVVLLPKNCNPITNYIIQRPYLTRRDDLPMNNQQLLNASFFDFNNPENLISYFCILSVIVFLISYLSRKIYLKKKKELQKKAREKEEKELAFQREFVVRNSSKVKAIYLLNHKSHFEDIPYQHTLNKTCNSKKDYDRTRFKDYLLSHILDNRKEYDDLIHAVEKNTTLYSEYLDAYKKIINHDSPDDEDYYSYYDYFKPIEMEICTKLMLHPVTDIIIQVVKEYYSPNGQRFYNSAQDFTYQQIRESIKEAEQIEKNRETTKYQRGIMTDSLRYDIMKRDGFRCTICGAAASDGVKLHVDHIIPISKGGKTIPSNLRTLCERCNLGKRDKYDPQGIN